MKLAAMISDITLSGSSNGVCTSLGARDAFTAVKNIIEGSVQPIDLCEVETKNSQCLCNFIEVENVVWDCMHVSWAAVGLHDVLQERKLRFMDTSLRWEVSNIYDISRNLVAPLISILFKPSYRGKISFIPSEQPPVGDYQDPLKLNPSPLGKEWREVYDSFFLVSGGRNTLDF